MTMLEAAAPQRLEAALPTAATFTGPRKVFTRMMIRGALLQVITLGIYRFWLTTEMRRYLWSNTEIDGDSLDYTGTAVELLIGFLVALAILVPIYVLFFIAGLELGIYSQIAGVAAFLFLTAFGQYALYRARRYRLTRTIYRGIRFHQDGSAFGYAARAVAWSIPVLLTLGLLHPFAQASLERYKLSHTFYGDLRGAFAGSGARLLKRGLLLWVIVVAPFAIVLAITAFGVDWMALVRDLVAERFDEIEEAAAAHPAVISMAVALSSAFGWLMIAGVALFPAYQQIVMTWWLDGIRFGEVAVSSSLRKGQFYGIYLRLIGLAILVTIVLAILAGLAVVGVTSGVIGVGDISASKAQIGIMLGSVVFYIVVMMALWVCWQVAVRLAMWRMTVNSLQFSGFSALAQVRAQGDAASPVGEGLADALGAGGY